MSLKPLMIASSMIELGAGLGLLCLPSMVAELLTGVELASPEGLTIARMAGCGLTALGISCWMAHNQVGRGPVVSMLFYNVAVAMVLAYAGAVLKLSGWVLWAAVGLHGGMSVWCLIGLLRGSQALPVDLPR